MERLKGKTCLITGAAQGIGHRIAELFLTEGATFIAGDWRFAPAAAQPRFSRLPLDATDAEAVGAVASAHPEVAVLVNCVGFVANGALLDCSLEEFDHSMTVNVRSMVLTIGASLPGMLARADGSIINIASVASSVMAVPNRFAYSTRKAALIALTISVACDHIARGIRCNAISPGTLDTPALQKRFRSSGDAAAAGAAFIARQTMGRLGTAEEVAATAVLLASKEARFMSAANIIIDGGMSL